MVKIVKKGVPNVPFNEMLEYLESKTILPTKHWADIPAKAHTKGFMITGAMKEDLLADYLKAILKNKKEGLPYKEFSNKFDDIAAKHGWQYKGKASFRARVIYHTNTRMAYSAGRERQMQENKELRPYAEFVGNKRPNHVKLNGVHHLDSAFWDYYTPPIDWLCDCRKRSVSNASIKEYGLEVEPMMSDEDIPRETKQIKVNGQYKIVTLPKDVGYGFDYNPGKAAWGNFMPKEVFNAKRLTLKGQGEYNILNKGDWQSYGLDKNLPIQPAKAKIGENISKTLSAEAQKAQMVQLTKKAFNMKDDIEVIETAAGKMALDAKRLGEHLPIERAPFLPLMKEVLEEPAEVWRAFEESKLTGKVELRYRFIKVIKSEKNREFLFVAQSHKGQITGWTFIRKNQRELNKLRMGQLMK